MAVGPGVRRYILILLLIAYTLSFLDRQVLSILVEPIKQELHLSYGQIGLLTGPVFVIFYTFIGVPIAWLADRRSRPLIISVSLLLWSGFTAFSGFAGGFASLALARLGVGFGEAGCNPSSHSLIAEVSRPDKRASGLAFYSMGVPIGTLLGLAMGGLVADAYGWRVAFWVAAAPGIVLAAVIALTVKEPRAEAPVSLASSVLSPLKDMVQVVKVLAAKRTFWLVATGAGFSAFVGYGEIYFNSSFFQQCHGHELDLIAAGFGLKAKGFLGLVLGAVTGLGGMAGTLIGGSVADHGVGRDRRIFVSMPAIAALIAMPVIYLIFTVRGVIPAILLLFIPNIVSTIWYGPVYSTAQSVVEPRYRATAAALLLLILNLIGLGLGPTCLGFLSDFLARNAHLGVAEGLRWAMIGTGMVSVLAAALFWAARSTVREDVVS